MLCCDAVRGGGAEWEQWRLPHSPPDFNLSLPIPTIKLGPFGAGSRVGGFVHTLGPCGSLQRPLLRGWESLLLLPQPPRAFSIRGLRLYFPVLEPWVMRVWGRRVLPAALPALFCATESGPLGLSVSECGAAGSASGQTACPVRLTLRQSRSRHGHASPPRPGCPSPPLLPVWMNDYFLFPWCWSPLLFDSLSVLVVRGGAVCLPTPPSWFS